MTFHSREWRGGLLDPDPISWTVNYFDLKLCAIIVQPKSYHYNSNGCHGDEVFDIFRIKFASNKVFKSTCLLLAVFLKFIFSQKGKRCFILHKTFDFLFRKNFQFLQNLAEIPFMDSIFSKFAGLQPGTFQKYKLFCRYFSRVLLFFKSAYLREHLWVAASVHFNREDS